jgi:ferredoxin/flavodoxin---NADP+ reductase
LVCSGVAPDHLKIKSISKQFEKIAEDPRFSFFGSVVVGRTHRGDALAEHYDAVICGSGAMGSGTETFRRGPARHALAGHDADLSGARAGVVGNVALDVARILLTDPGMFALTDIADRRCIRCSRAALRKW